MDLTGMLQAAAGAAGEDKLYIESVFSTHLYTGTGAAQTITNGIDLDGEGGLVWIKNRDQADSHILTDTERGATEILVSNTTAAEATDADTLTAFNSDGFALGADVKVNTSTEKYVSWTFRKAPKFFDVVTYSGDGTSNRQIAHNLGSAPGFIVIKRTSGLEDWICYHRVDGSSPTGIKLNSNNSSAGVYYTAWFNDTPPTDSVFTISDGNDLGPVNASGSDYIAYLFAHDAGGFGDDGEQNVISCGSVTFPSDQFFSTVNLGFEPQWIMIKKTNGIGNWRIADFMRGGFDVVSAAGSGFTRVLEPNTSDAEGSDQLYIGPSATGFYGYNEDDAATWIYVAIRRGPMKTPTAGTEVFGLNARTGTGANATVTGSAGVSDAVLIKNSGSAVASLFAARLTGTNYLVTSTTAAQVAAATTILQANPWDVMDGVKVGTTSTITNASSNTFINYLFSRAPGFFDVVCYTGTGANRTVAHNLGVVPELMIVKSRNNAIEWAVYSVSLGNDAYINLDKTDSEQPDAAGDFWNLTTPTSSVFSVDDSTRVNASTYTYVAYLFASLAGVSDIGTYTGNGSSVTVTTGFQPRFILVKRTDSTGNWIVGDSARDLVAGNDPALFLNSSAAETTGQDWVDVSATGFTANETALNANVSTATYIYLAIS